MNTQLSTSSLNDAYKCELFEQIAGVVKELVRPPISLQEKGYSVYRDALAFLVEGMSALYPAEQTKVMLNGLVEQIQKKSANEAKILLDEQISTIYGAVLADTISKAPTEEKRNFEAIGRMYDAFRSLRAEDCKNGKDAEFGGINQFMLPAWYKAKYVGE